MIKNDPLFVTHCDVIYHNMDEVLLQIILHPHFMLQILSCNLAQYGKNILPTSVTYCNVILQDTVISSSPTCIQCISL